MGIVNVTPDSFFAGSRATAVDTAVQLADRHIAEGASIIDVGGQSTRPTSQLLSSAEEKERVLPVVQALHSNFPDTVISVDTFYAEVAEAAVEAGASMVNDISGGMMDAQMLTTVASLHVPYVCMHTKGTPQNMQQLAQYENVVQEVLDYFIERIGACSAAGIHDVIIDPGFGFAKTIEHNFQLLKSLEIFDITDRPLLLGVSRKSTIYKTLGTTASEALNGTTVLNTIGLLKGASILRVHDVKEAMEAIQLVESYNQA